MPTLTGRLDESQGVCACSLRRQALGAPLQSGSHPGAASNSTSPVFFWLVFMLCHHRRQRSFWHHLVCPVGFQPGYLDGGRRVRGSRNGTVCRDVGNKRQASAAAVLAMPPRSSHAAPPPAHHPASQGTFAWRRPNLAMAQRRVCRPVSLFSFPVVCHP